MEQTDREREAEILRTLGLQDRVPPFDPATVFMHDFTGKPDQDDDDELLYDQEEPGPFRAAQPQPPQQQQQQQHQQDDDEEDEL